MDPKDEEKIAFIIDMGTFCYKIIPFGLKNSRSIYQRMVTKVFKGLMERNVEAYMDDMLMKSLSFDQHLKDLDEVFTVLKIYKMKLNPTKYVFSITTGKFLGFMVRKNRIEPNLKKLKALTDMGLLKTFKEI